MNILVGHTNTDLSAEHEARYFPLLEKSMSLTGPEWPFRLVRSQGWLKAACWIQKVLLFITQQLICLTTALNWHLLNQNLLYLYIRRQKFKRLGNAFAYYIGVYWSDFKSCSTFKHRKCFGCSYCSKSGAIYKYFILFPVDGHKFLQLVFGFQRQSFDF